MRWMMLAMLCGMGVGGAAAPGERMVLRQGWAIQSSAFVRDSGEALSSPGYKTREWYRATLPSTVLKALVENRVYPDPYFGMNLRGMAGTSYPVAANFSNIPMPPESPFRNSWWYRTEFQVPAEYRGRTLWLHFDGINFRANVWLNGRRVAAADKMAGAWRLFNINVPHAATPGRANALAVEVFPPQPEDLAITFVDWNPMPPDKVMGIWRDVTLVATGPVAVRFPYAAVKLNLPAADRAEVTVSAELTNGTGRAVKGVLKARLEGRESSAPVRLGANESRVVALGPQTIANPRLWWPAEVGEQNLYPLELEFASEGQVSDRAAMRFGIREVASAIDEQGHRLFRINGKNILIRGAGYTFDMLLASSPERQEAELKYVRDMHLNAVRLEGKLEDDHFLEMCDRMGILVMAGWCCCDHWEHWQDWDEEDRAIAAESLKDQARRLRGHPSLVSWMNGSDNPPPADVEKMYTGVLNEYQWPNPVISSATAKPAASGPTGVKMTGPYEYVAPWYWLTDKTRGGAHGFNTETGPGPAVPPIERLRRMLPPDHLWPIDSWWGYHAGGGPFRDLGVFTEALDARYGAARDVEEYARKAQAMAYEGHRAMFEAFGRNRYGATGVIQWMLNNAWPSMIWHLYDWYLRPGGSYFGAKKACEPLHVQYSYDDGSVAVVNSFYGAQPGLRVRARVFDLEMRVKHVAERQFDAPPDSSTRVFAIPAIEGLSTVYFVRLDLADAAGKPVSSNFYWLPREGDVLAWDKSTWYHTPTERFGDLTALHTLAPVELKAGRVSAVEGDEGTTRVTVENPGPGLAFFVRLKVNQGAGGEEVLPVLWDDNYFSLLPGEKREVTARYPVKALGNAAPMVEIEGWNVQRRALR